MSTIYNITETNNGRVSKILDFVSKANNFYFAIGKDTPWTIADGLNISDINPPTPNVDATTIPEIILFKKADVAIPVKVGTTCLDVELDTAPTNGLILTGTSTEKGLVFIPAEDITLDNGVYSAQPNAVYVYTEIAETDYTELTSRTIGFYSSITLASGVTEGLSQYTPAQVEYGILDWVSYNSPIPRDSNKTHRIELIINF